LLIGGIAAVLIVIVGIILPLDRSVARAHQRVAQKQADLAWMQSAGPYLAAAGPAVSRPQSQESLLVTVDRAAREAGLGKALTSSEPGGAGGLRVRLDDAPFDVLVGWRARLSEQHGIKIEAASIDNSGEPGLVNASLVLQVQ